jgi:hypothetical protein
MTRLANKSTVPLRALSLLALAALCLAGCGSPEYKLNVRLPAGTVVHRDAKVLLDGVVVGRVADVGREDGKVLATLLITEEDAARGKLRPGLIATVNRDRGIDLDSGEIDGTARPLPSGSTIEGTTKFDLLVRRYARWQTVVVFFMGALGLFIVFWVFRLFFKMSWVFLALALAAGAAALLHQPVTHVVETVYTGDEGDAVATPDSDGGGRSFLDIPKPSPEAVAFFATWLGAFVLIQVGVGAALRATRAKS